MIDFPNASVYGNPSGKWQEDKGECCTGILVKIETCAKKAIIPLRTSLALLTNQYAMPKPHTLSDGLASNSIHMLCTRLKEQKSYKATAKYQAFYNRESLYI